MLVAMYHHGGPDDAVFERWQVAAAEAVFGLGDDLGAVLLEGDNPLRFTDLAVFVAPSPPADEALFVRRRRNLAGAERVKSVVQKTRTNIRRIATRSRELGICVPLDPKNVERTAEGLDLINEALVGGVVDQGESK